MNALEFLVGYTAFFLFATFIFGQIGLTVFTGVPTIVNPTCTLTNNLPTCPDCTGLVAWLDIGFCWIATLGCWLVGLLTFIFNLIACFIAYMQFFFSLMSVNSSFGILGLVLIAPLLVGLIYIIIQLIPFVGKGT